MRWSARARTRLGQGAAVAAVVFAAIAIATSGAQGVDRNLEVGRLSVSLVGADTESSPDLAACAAEAR